MDPTSDGGPMLLLAELIELLRDIKDSGDTGQAAAAIGAVQRIAARSTAGAGLTLPAETLPPTDIQLDAGTNSSTSDAPVHAPSPTHEDAPTAVQSPSVSPPTLSDTVTPTSTSHVALDTGVRASPSDTRVAPDSRPLLDDSPETITVQPPPRPAPAPPITTAPAPAPHRKNTRTEAPTQQKTQTRAPGGTKPGVGPQPESAPRKPRNLIVCIDGTSNQFSEKNTNVVELYYRLVKDDNQLTFYNSGIGTYATPSWKSWKYLKQVLWNKIDLAIAWNFEKILLSAYLWLCENYREGDKIYLFGFSRGAYQVRALSAMIESVGLLYKGNQDQIPFAYQLYAETKPFKNIDAMRARFKETFSWTVTVEFVGVWDTVSSVGLVRNKTLPGTTDGMKHVKYFRHALALHERRVKFLPENAREGLGPLKEDTEGDRPHTKEVWFAGSHSNIGGGAMPNEKLTSFGPALRWMSFEATLAGVQMKETPRNWQDVAINNSLTPIWKTFEIFPFTRLTYRKTSELTYRPHLGRPRKIRANQLIHETAFNQRRNGTPAESQWRARLPEFIRWDKDVLQGLNLIEADPYTAASHYLEALSKPEFSSDTILGLKALVSTDAGWWSLRDVANAADILSQAIYRILTYEGVATLEDIHTTLDVLENVMARCGFLYTESPMPAARTHAARIALEDEQLARKIMEFCDSAMVGNPLEHPAGVYCVAYMSDGDRIVSGCNDGAIRIWNIETRQIVGAPMTGHTDTVFCVAVSAGGTKIASGSADKTIRVWSVESGAMVALLEGHDNWVRSVAFSPDGMRLVSGSDDRTIRVWDVATPKTVVGPIQRHSRSVFSVAFSPDGSRISAADGSVHVWDAQTGEELWQTERSFFAFSVAYSPDGKRIVAGCGVWKDRLISFGHGLISFGGSASDQCIRTPTESAWGGRTGQRSGGGIGYEN